MRKIGIVRACIGMCTIALVVGCASQTQQSVFDETEQTVRIAVMYGGGTYDYERSLYTELYEITHPKTKMEFTSAIDNNAYDWSKKPNEIAEMKKMLTGDNPPDVVVLSSLKQVSKLTEENLLSPLDAFLKKDSVDMNAFVPAVIEGIKGASSDGQLYALAPLYETKALFYNRGIFDKVGIDPPTDGMTWEEVFSMADKVASGNGAERVYGIAFTETVPTNVFDDAKEYVTQLKLSMYNDTYTAVTVNTPQWNKVITTLIGMRKQKLIPEEALDATGGVAPSQYNGSPFFSGKLAMVLGRPSLINQIISSNEALERTGEGQPIEWDIVSIPTFPEAPDAGSAMTVSGMLAINAKAQNAEGAWDYIRFIHSDQWARIKARSEDTISSLTAYVKPKDGYTYNVKAFTSVKPVVESNVYESPLSYEIINEIEQIGRMKIEEVVQGKKTAADALKEWEAEANPKLKKYNEDNKR
jgi:multiple sugar transport system substrate-binding protein